MKTPLPGDEARRLNELRRYDILDTPPETSFDDLVSLAAQICQTPVAMISLVDEKRQWFKSRMGIGVSETSRDVSFCAHAILHKDEVTEVRDALADQRFAGNPLVTSDPHARFYAGAPLIGLEGHAVGTLCVMDRTPRQLSADQKTALRILSRHVVAQLELRLKARELKNELTERQRAEDEVRKQHERLARSRRDKDGLLALAEKSRNALLGVLEDEQQNTRKLRESEERFRQVVENIREVFWISDATFNEIHYISPAYEAVWGRTCASLYESPRNWIDAIHTEDRARVIQNIESKLVEGRYEETFRILRDDGSIRWIHDRGFAVRDAAGKVYRMVGIAEDITERRDAERLALRSQRLEAIGTLAGGVAHDLNNALAPILMGLAILKSEYPQESKVLEMFQTSAKHAADMVRQLVSFARGAEGERMLIQPALIVNDMQGIIKGSFPKSIQLVVNCDQRLPTVLGDATQLHQVLLNLCVNARDAMPNGGTLTIEGHRKEVDAAYASTIPDAKPGDYVLLRVRDTGTGIRPEILDRIFEPFFTTKGPEKGTGLGLSTVMGIIKGHGGFLHVYSQPGQGSTFNVYLPADRHKTDAKSESNAAIDFRGNGETILFVDDELAVRETARAVLRRLNFKPLTAVDGADGLMQAALHRNELRAIITDLHMPNLDGLGFVRTLRGMLPDIPIVVASGRMEDSMINDFKTLGVTSRLDKPFTEAELAGALKNLLAPK